MLDLHVVVQFELLLWKQTILSFLFDQFPNALTRFFRRLKTRQGCGGNLISEKVEKFVARIHEITCGTDTFGRQAGYRIYFFSTIQMFL